ncbi:MAG: FAD-dependent monooxygenase [Desulfovibrionaceae bacterium]|nr:FAD-dependent monooxygenase [Desulfovibrionaceae bacterium]
MDDYDVAIIGAGPAGAALAKELGQQRKVLLVDARPMQAPLNDLSHGWSDGGSAVSAPRFQEKCCGGLLAPDARNWLSRQKLFLPASVLDGMQPDSLRAIDLNRNVERVYPTEYINLSRGAFEQWLLSLVPSEATTLYGHRLKNVKREENGFRLTLRIASGGLAEARCRFLVGADGANSTVRRFLGRPVRPQAAYLAVQDVFPVQAAKRISGPELLQEYAAFFHPALTDFYGWIIPKKDRIILGLAMPPQVRQERKAAGHMALLKQLLKPAGYDFDGPYQRSGCLLLRPSLDDVCLGDDGVFLIGEAAGFISPSSAEGYSYAFVSAQSLAAALLRHNHKDGIMRAYRLSCLKLRANLIYKLSKSLIMYSPLARCLIMQSGALAKD